MIKFNPKQAELIKLLKADKLARINILEGAVRSGKTWISLIVFALWVATMPQDATFLMVAKTLTSLKRNCLELLQTLVGEDNFYYNLSQKQGTLFGRTVYLEGVNDARAESKIRGMTLTGAYCDEVTLFTEDFFTMLLSRLSTANAKLFGSTNPDHPLHWLNVKYINRAEELDMLVIKFTILDNEALDPDYVEALKQEYTGVFYKRFILGEWCVAEGSCYPKFADNPDDYIVTELPQIARAVIGVDFGGNGSAHAFSCTGFTRGFKQMVLLKEYYRKEIISPLELESDFVKFAEMCQREYYIADCYCDSAEQTLIQGLRKAADKNRIPINIMNARKKPINDRIWCLNRLMAANRFKIHESCTNTIDALRAAVWDSKSVEDKRLDNGTYNIDSLDSLEYSFEHEIHNLIGAG